MKQVLHLGLFVLTALLSMGFTESTRIIQVNPDGSGEIYVRVLFNPDHLAEKPDILSEEKLQEKAATYGSDVHFVISKEVTNENQWKGYLAKYSFSDISKLQIRPASLAENLDMDELDGELLGWTFRVEQRQNSIILEIIPSGEKAAGSTKEAGIEEKAEVEQKEIADDAWEDDSGWDEKQKKKDDGRGWGNVDKASLADDATLSQQQIGRRYTTYIRINGLIGSTNPESLDNFRSKLQPDTITLNDEQWGVMWQNMEARQVMKMESRNLSALVGKEVQGFRSISIPVKIAFTPVAGSAQ